MKELKPLMLLTGAVLITVFLVPLGILHNFVKSLIGCFKLKFWYGLYKFVGYWLAVLYQIWGSIKYLMIKVATALDLIWNATSGELVEDCVTTVELTLYGRGDITISAATGELEDDDKLNKVGKGFSEFLNITLEDDHCKKAYKKLLAEQENNS